MAKVKAKVSSSQARARMTVLSFVLICVVASLVSVILSKNMLIVSNYRYECNDIKRSVRILQLSDLNGATFGENNKTLVDRVEMLQPTMVVMTGDMISVAPTDEEIDRLCTTITALKELVNYPIYYSLGENEQAYIEANGKGIIKKLDAAGAKVLDGTYQDIDMKDAYNDQHLRIGGIDGTLNANSVANSREQKFMKKFLNTKRVTILLHHDATDLLNYGYIDSWKTNIVMSGHRIGGVVRVSVFGGLFGIDGKYFSDYSKGVYTFGEKDEKTVTVSAGLGTNVDFPSRFNNLPNIVCLDIERPGLTTT